MDNPESAHCRLCAVLKPCSEMIDLQEDSEKKLEVVSKLSRLNTTLEICGNMLPKTVCFVCINLLDKAIEFVTSVEQAQTALNNIITLKIKREDSFSDNETYSYDHPADEDDEFVKMEHNKSDKAEPLIKEPTSTPVFNCSDKTQVKIVVENISNTAVLVVDGTPPDERELTWRQYNWTCEYCESQFQSVEQLKAHSIQYHNCCNAFKCTDCNITTMRLDSFIIHVKRHREFLKLSCYICYMKFATIFEANLHSKVHMTSKYSCKGCNSMFDNAEDKKHHSMTYYRYNNVIKKQVEKISKEVLTCLFCKKTFKKKATFNNHLLTHTERKRDHTCDICGKGFFDKTILAGHMILHREDKPYQCEKCKGSFKTPKQLSDHMKTHDAIKPFACDQCGKCFRLQKHLTSHKIIHTDLLPHVCTYCNKGFRFKAILDQHIRLHTGVKPYSCNICQRAFTNWSNWNKHMLRKHNMDMRKKKQIVEEESPMDSNAGEVTMDAGSAIEWQQDIVM